VINIKVAKIQSVDAYNELTVHTQLPDDYRELWMPSLLHGWMEMYAALQDVNCKYIGRLAIYLDNRSRPKTIEILSLYVSGEVRERGVATALMQSAEKVAMNKDAKQLKLSVSPDNGAALNLYKKLGYNLKCNSGNLIEMSKKLK
jgi:ribosomal protein S18 acetylase RimI-like enzyme